MRRPANIFALLCALLVAAAPGPRQLAQSPAPDSRANAQAAQPGGDRVVYADFESLHDNRPVSSRGGFIQLISYQESTPSKMKGLANVTPPTPELVRLKPDDPNRAAAFDYELYPNQYAGVGIQIGGLPDKDGKPVADDLSAYKYISMDIYATGVPRLRLEVTSRGQGINMDSGFPSSAFKVKPGLNTYKIPLNSLAQPSWADTKVGTKEVLRKLTGVTLTAFCEGCSPTKGTVVVDNVVFEK